MQPSIMITNGGPHPAAYWAETTAARIVQLGDEARALHPGPARRFELAVIDILEAHHAEVQDHERGQLVEHGHGRLCHAIEPECHCLDDKVAEIVVAAEATPWAAHYARPEAQAVMRQILGDHFATSMHIERSWHADRHPDTDEARAFRAAHPAA